MKRTARKIEILNLNTQFRRIYSKGSSAVRPSLVVYSKPNGLKFNRVGITVSKKIGKAVIRNRAKRRLREVFRLNSVKTKTGYDFILVARSRTAFVGFTELQNDFLNAEKHLGVLKDE